MQGLEIHEWDEQRWRDSAADWAALLADSGCDPLFLSWQWMLTWWTHFARTPAWRLRLLAAYRGGRLVGIAPLYESRASRRFVPVRSLQFIGSSWRGDNTVVSEYLDFIAAPADRDAVRGEFLRHLAAHHPWDELIVGYSEDPQAWVRALARGSLERACHARVIEQSCSYTADLSKGLGAWLGWLGQSTRRSAWHLRHRLAQLGNVSLEEVAPEAVDAAFEALNRLHQQRWGRAAFAGSRLAFHLELAHDAATRGALAMSLLRIDGTVISVLYDLRCGSRQYNLKAAFDPAMERRFSLGLIHLGYALEACAARGVTHYDFLAGPGQHTDFKSHLGQVRRELATVQVLKGPLLRRLYGWYDGIQHAVRG